MKLILLAATAALALPAIGQAQMTGGQTTTQSAPTTSTSDPQATTPPADPSTAPAGTDGTAGQQPMTTGTPAGGYQPSGSAMQGTMSPGVQPTYQPAPSPSQAYPAPAPKDSYPVCKKGQYDGCIEAGSSSGHAKARRHRK